MKLTPLWFVPVVPLLVTGCPLLDVETDVSEVCVTYAGVQIDGASETSVQASFTIDELGQLNTFIDQDADLEFVRAEIRATDGTDLGFVDAAEVSVAGGDPESTLPTLPVISCDGDCLPDGASLQIPATVQHSAVDYVRTGSLVIAVDLHGQVPAVAWTADVDVCMKGHFRYTVEP